MKKQIILCFIVSLLISQNCSKETIKEESWSRLYGGSATDFAQDMIHTKDGGYLLCGGTMSSDGDISMNHGDWDFWIIKLKEDGILEWQKSYGGSQYESAESCIQTTDGGYVITGLTHSTDGDVNGNNSLGQVWVIKLTDSGVIEWNQICGDGIGFYLPKEIIETNAGEIMIVGNREPPSETIYSIDGFIFCLDSNGSVKWEKYYGEEGDDRLFSIIQSSDGNLLVAGTTSSKEGEFSGNKGCCDGWLMMVNSSGNPVFNKTFGTFDCETFNSVIQTGDGNFVTVGSYYSEFDLKSGDILVTKINTSGNLIWSKCLGGSDSDAGYHLIESADKSLFIVGTTMSNDRDVIINHGNSDIWIVEISDSGETRWKQTFGGNMNDIGEVILRNSFGNIVVAGTTESNNGTLTRNKGGYDYWIFSILKP